MDQVRLFYNFRFNLMRKSDKNSFISKTIKKFCKLLEIFWDPLNSMQLETCLIKRMKKMNILLT
jgi:hypothetical protein